MSINWHDSDARESAIAAKWAAAEERLKVAERMAQALRAAREEIIHYRDNGADPINQHVLAQIGKALNEWEAQK